MISPRIARHPDPHPGIVAVNDVSGNIDMRLGISSGRIDQKGGLGMIL
jgi:hypothetical protein